MAARKRTWTPEIVRQRIRTGVIARRLMKHVMGEIEMTPTQVSAGLGLLKKVLPDLSATELSGELKTTDVSAKPLTAEEWEKEHCVEAAGGASESTH